MYKCQPRLPTICVLLWQPPHRISVLRSFSQLPFPGGPWFRHCASTTALMCKVVSSVQPTDLNGSNVWQGPLDQRRGLNRALVYHHPTLSILRHHGENEESMGHFSISRAPFTLFVVFPTQWGSTPVVHRSPSPCYPSAWSRRVEAEPFVSNGGALLHIGTTRGTPKVFS